MNPKNHSRTTVRAVTVPDDDLPSLPCPRCASLVNIGTDGHAVYAECGAHEIEYVRMTCRQCATVFRAEPEVLVLSGVGDSVRYISVLLGAGVIMMAGMLLHHARFAAVIAAVMSCVVLVLLIARMVRILRSSGGWSIEIV